MKSFKQFNESIRDLMTGPSKEEAIKSLEGLSNKEKILNIIKYQLDFDLLPRKKDGRCYYDGNLMLWPTNGVKRLPDNLTVEFNLYCSHNQLTELPKGLHVRGNLVIQFNEIELELPDDAIIGGKYIKGSEYEQN